jgi:hypothetical protein
MIAAGVNVKALSTFMGHATVAITLEVYGHLLPGSEDEAAGLLDTYPVTARLAPLLARRPREPASHAEPARRWSSEAGCRAERDLALGGPRIVRLLGPIRQLNFHAGADHDRFLAQPRAFARQDYLLRQEWLDLMGGGPGGQRGSLCGSRGRW